MKGRKSIKKIGLSSYRKHQRTIRGGKQIKYANKCRKCSRKVVQKGGRVRAADPNVRVTPALLKRELRQVQQFQSPELTNTQKLATQYLPGIRNHKGEESLLAVFLLPYLTEKGGLEGMGQGMTSAISAGTAGVGGAMIKTGQLQTSFSGFDDALSGFSKDFERKINKGFMKDKVNTAPVMQMVDEWISGDKNNVGVALSIRESKSLAHYSSFIQFFNAIETQLSQTLKKNPLEQTLLYEPLLQIVQTLIGLWTNCLNMMNPLDNGSISGFLRKIMTMRPDLAVDYFVSLFSLIPPPLQQFLFIFKETSQKMKVWIEHTAKEVKAKLPESKSKSPQMGEIEKILEWVKQQTSQKQATYAFVHNALEATQVLERITEEENLKLSFELPPALDIALVVAKGQLLDYVNPESGGPFTDIFLTPTDSPDWWKPLNFVHYNTRGDKNLDWNKVMDYSFTTVKGLLIPFLGLAGGATRGLVFVGDDRLAQDLQDQVESRLDMRVLAEFQTWRVLIIPAILFLLLLFRKCYQIRNPESATMFDPARPVGGFFQETGEKLSFLNGIVKQDDVKITVSRAQKD